MAVVLWIDRRSYVPFSRARRGEPGDPADGLEATLARQAREGGNPGAIGSGLSLKFGSSSFGEGGLNCQHLHLSLLSPRDADRKRSAFQPLCREKSARIPRVRQMFY